MADRLVRRLRGRGRSMRRRWGRWIKVLLRLPTAPWRASPDFIIIGVHKCGTTSLHAELADHHQVVPALVKEIHHFESPLRTRLGMGLYLAHFPRRRELHRGPARRVTGEATPGYVYSHRAAQRIRQRLPHCRLIVIIRNPTDRAMSHYHHSRRLGYEARSMVEVIGESLASARSSSGVSAGRGVDTWLDRSHFVERGLYAQFLTRWYELFGPEQILVVSLEELVADTPATMADVCRFIGIDTPANDAPFPKRNASSERTVDPSIVSALDEYYREPNRDLARLLRQYQPDRSLPPWLAEFAEDQ